MRKTKIVCTIGPACETPDMIGELIKNGMNVARFNFSHSNHDYHKKLIKIVRMKSKELDMPVAILMDTKGPEIRTGIVEDGEIYLEKGKKVDLVMEEVICTEDRISISYRNLAKEVQAGNHIYIADGTVDLIVEGVENNTIHCRVIVGGEIGSRKNVNVPDIKVGLPAITEKDIKDINFAIEQDADFIAASFIRKPSDVMEIREILNQNQANIHIISKIESREGVKNIDDIITHSDGIMVARGDLGVQTSPSEIPLIQKRIIHKCNDARKPVITATQMLDSMIHNPRPTRAESTDVANAILDGTDAVMLSGETAGGKYPIKSLQMMNEIINTTEASPEYLEYLDNRSMKVKTSNMVQDAMCQSARQIAHNISASAIITPTLSGNTARLLGRYKPWQPIVAATAKEKTMKQLLLVSNVYPIMTELADKTSDMLSKCIKGALDNKYIRNLSKVVVVAGVPIHSRNAVNLVKVYIIADVLAKGKGLNGGISSGNILKVKSSKDAFKITDMDEGKVLLVPYLNYYMEHLLDKAEGVIVEEVSLIPIEEIRRKYPDLVLITEVQNACKSLESGFKVTLDGMQGLIYDGEIENKNYVL
jgi:pyruvate kinase